MTAIFINPQLVVQKNDKFTTGIVYMPITLAYVISNFKEKNIKTKLIDLYGKNPTKCFEENNYLIFGEKIEEIENDVFKNVSCIFINANQVGNHISILKIIKFLKIKHKETPIIILENSQAVTAYSLSEIKDEFLKLGCDFILIGDLENISVELYKNIKKIDHLKTLDGVISKNFCNNKINFVNDLDKLPFPAWEDFPLENYWKLGYSHGPLSSKKYLPMLSSRGCPYPCNFCVIPQTNERKWRSRSPDNVVKEIEYFRENFDIDEFHFEDLNPTVNDKRTKELCNLLIEKNLKISWKMVAGTKVESIKDLETVRLLKKSGCNYISISPESGSKDLMKEINKPFNYEHAIKIIKEMKKNKIFSQACFVIGYPGEKKIDLKKTKNMIFNLTKIGIDEIAIFIITPVPGSKIYENFEGFETLSNLTFSPIWRTDYKSLNRIRLHMYSIFLITKFIFHPLRVFKQALNFFNKSFNTKMEMVPYKVLKLKSFENNAKK